jgi:hypothetical protein
VTVLRDERYIVEGVGEVFGGLRTGEDSVHGAS